MSLSTVPGKQTTARIRTAAKAGMRITVTAVLTSVALAAVKIVTGLVGNSYALVADGIESVLDVFASLVVLGGLRLSMAPRTERFPYGLGKAEALGTLAVATVLLIAAVGISVQAIQGIVAPHAAPRPFTLLVLVGVVATKEALFRTIFAKGEAIGSQALVADAWHHRADAITSLAAFIGISVALVLGEGYESADDWAALLACGVIAFNGVRLFRTAPHRYSGRRSSRGGGEGDSPDCRRHSRRGRCGGMPHSEKRLGVSDRHSCGGGWRPARSPRSCASSRGQECTADIIDPGSRCACSC